MALRFSVQTRPEEGYTTMQKISGIVQEPGGRANYVGGTSDYKWWVVPFLFVMRKPTRAFGATVTAEGECDSTQLKERLDEMVSLNPGFKYSEVVEVRSGYQ